MYRIITVARQYASGGGPIASRLAKSLGWELLDNALITRIAQAANIDRKTCERFDEALDSWLHRLVKRTFGGGVFEGAAPAGEVFDSAAMAALSRKLIEQAAEMGNCVIVGRGGQCILEGCRDVFHLFVYAPMEERIRRLRVYAGPEQANADVIRASDRERAAYVKHHYGKEWCDPTLYDAMFSSSIGEEAVAAAVLAAMGAAKQV